jgi:hypothetical protein
MGKGASAPCPRSTICACEWWARGACHRAALRADPLALPTLKVVASARILAARLRPSFASFVALERLRAQGMPGAVAPARLVCTNCAKERTRANHRYNRTRRHSLRSGLRLIRDLLGVPCSLAAVALRFVSQHLIPASGDRDHTISLVRLGSPSSLASQRVHRNPPPIS